MKLKPFRMKKLLFGLSSHMLEILFRMKSCFQIVNETINFPIPLVKVTETISSLELFHGPTLAFKDVGARFMSRCLGYFSKRRGEEE